MIKNRPRVYHDILEAVDYLFSINPKLAEDFLDRIEEAKIKIQNTPNGFQIQYLSVRTILLRQFAYHIYYIVEDYKIIILAVLHAQSGEKKIGKI
ncbi:type II toxin-antitoxin system RelE/ParE family toxin [Kaistella jeonii]|uniref:type II toxin-antitoxin system RelE/ParE family toxin n=1 Tax=Kaistella jeonii TaxID=266749 RepID=UPI000A45F0C5|nr:type II toxin-antitoxin system RelE/ParE family toxin [Kaistella jeonii]